MRNSRLLSILLVLSLITLILPFATTPILPMISVTNHQTMNANYISPTITPPLLPRTVRVAVYDEPNLTAPTYATTPGVIHNNASGLAAVLNSYPLITATLLDVHDIYNHQLLTADYDVLALVDNFPRENITDMVQEFWLGGGGLMVFDGAAGFLCHFGILPPEAVTTSGSGVYWHYANTGFNITVRHPISKSHSLYTVMTGPSGHLRWDWTALQGSSIAGDLTAIARATDNPGRVSVLAFDPSDRGGKVVTFAEDYDGATIANIDQMIADAVDWLCPRPKGRILFDLSHQPRLGIDPWDSLTLFPGNYRKMRDIFVNHSFTFDKLYPSPTGNFTLSRLTPYDMLIVVAPDYDISASDRTAVESWVNAGGGLLIFGEDPTGAGFLAHDQRINFLLANFDLQMNTTVGAFVINTISMSTMHPTTEGCTNLYFNAHGYVNITSSAYPIWNLTSTDIVVGGQTYGNGRVILTGDINFPDATSDIINEEDNAQFTLNLANWLSSSTADVLVYADGVAGSDPNDNVYRGPVAQALNDYGISFYVTFTASYLNLSLMTESWTLVIIDNNNYPISSYVDEIINYVDTGGLLLIRSYQQRQVSLEPLCHYLGYDYNGTYITLAPPDIHIWASGHPVFNQPNTYGASIINTTFNPYNTDFVHVDLFSNATPIAGITPTPEANVSAIILSANGRALSNTMALTEYMNDTDDSTYPDAVEIWQNEIAFMLRPHLAFTTNVPATVPQGTVLTFSVDIDNIVGRPALNGEMTVNVPAGLGTLTDPATQTFTSPLGPGSGDTITWHVTVTGLGNFTLGFTATFDGLPGTSYTTLPITADVEAIPLLVLPGLPWWWWIVLVVIVIIVVIIIIILLLRRRGSKST